MYGVYSIQAINAPAMIDRKSMIGNFTQLLRVNPLTIIGIIDWNSANITIDLANQTNSERNIQISSELDHNDLPANAANQLLFASAELALLDGVFKFTMPLP